jgi:lipopolysaccharide transport system ATP-binding protein
MGDTAIRVDRLSKQYRIGERSERYRTLRDALASTATAPLRWARSIRRRGNVNGANNNTIWALKDVSFEIPRGAVVGVIGRNGAGKSTLLKILSRITEPTEGFAEIHGRVGTLLEVGTGFHPELTGRENIYLNGAILGMKRAEIDRKFDEIVDFAGTDKFVDTPVKHYSSGMHLRLAFAVAAYLEPEILLVDEVLAVGDVMFQKKCIGKMSDIASQGRTVLFVSHNLGAVKELCDTSVVIANGRLDFIGPVGEGLVRYSRSMQEAEAHSNGDGGWRSITVDGAGDGAVGLVPTLAEGKPLTVRARLDLRDDYRNGFIFLILENALGDTMVHRRIDIETLCQGSMKAGSYTITAELPVLPLAPGVYTLHLKFRADNSAGDPQRYVSDKMIVDASGPMEGLSRALLAPACHWQAAPLVGAGARGGAETTPSRSSL